MKKLTTFILITMLGLVAACTNAPCCGDCNGETCPITGKKMTTDVNHGHNH